MKPAPPVTSTYAIRSAIVVGEPCRDRLYDRDVKILVVSGIWPPDAGGPASHAPEVCDYLAGRGHGIEVVTTADASPSPRPYPVHWISRRLPAGIRHLRAATVVRAHARGCDVVYSTGMEGRSAVGARLARTPLVQRLPSDPAFERAHWLGLTRATFERFQDERGVRVGALRWARDRELASAARVVCPSSWLRDVVVAWGIDHDRVEVLPHALTVPALDDRGELRRRYGFDGRTLVLAGRLVPQKSLDVALRAVSLNDGVSLVVAGDGSERERAQALAVEFGLGGRARFLGPQPRQAVFELFRAADAALLSSSWESFGLVVAEALAVGTPVLSTAVGGVAEVVEDGRNGLLVPAGDPEALGAAIKRFFADQELRERLRAAAAESVRRFAPEIVYARLEAILEDAAKR
jgi:glycosyltransferase involved in cell wall biosynthesis